MIPIAPPSPFNLQSKFTRRAHRALFGSLDQFFTVRLEESTTAHNVLGTYFPGVEIKKFEKSDTDYILQLVQKAIENPDSKLAYELAQRPNLKEEAGDLFNQLVHKAIENPGSKLAYELAQRPNLKEEARPEQFTELVKKAIANPDSMYAGSLANRPNLNEEPGQDSLDEVAQGTISEFKVAYLPNASDVLDTEIVSLYVRLLTDDPNSDLVQQLFERPNLKEEAGDLFNQLVQKAIENPDSKLAYELAQYPNLKNEVTTEQFNQLVQKAIDNPNLRLAQGLAKQGSIFEGFTKEFNSLSRDEQQGFCNWLNNILTREGITPADKQDFTLYFPRVMRARIQSGITSAQAA
jgi:hypothetical protein